MLQRVLEPEVMDSAEEAVDYNQIDHSHVNRIFVDDFLAAYDGELAAADRTFRIFDAGTGTALIPIELVKRSRCFHVTASDLAAQMLEVAQSNVTAAGLDQSIDLVLGDCKALAIPDESFDAIMSNSIVHHIPEPKSVIEQLWRITKRGGLIFIRDLARPDDLPTLDQLVQMYAGDSNAHQQQMFRDSLHAALTLNEVQELLVDLGIARDAVQMTSDRHWTINCRKPH